MSDIQMVDLKAEYLHLKEEIDTAVIDVMREARFINGPAVSQFSERLSQFLDNTFIATCGNGTDALQLACMALNLPHGSEVIVPAFTYIAPIEVLILLGLQPVLVDVDEHNFNIDSTKIEAAITDKTSAIMPVHLFGQSCEMKTIGSLAKKYNLKVIEDNAQSIGCQHQLGLTGTLGDVGCLSFFPSKNLGAYGDGGAVTTNNANLAKEIKGIAQHGQTKAKYVHETIGINSRLDSIQAAILNVKLASLTTYISRRRKIAANYNSALATIAEIETPKVMPYSNHVYHQYVIKVKSGRRDVFKKHLAEKGIPSMIYYPFLVNEQPAYRDSCVVKGILENGLKLTKEVLALPIHPYLSATQQEYIINTIQEYFE